MQRKKLGKEIKLGIFFAVALFIFFWGINYLKGTDIFTRQTRFHVIYNEVGGLLESNAVMVSGVKIGQVDRIAFHPDGSGRVIVTAVVGQQIAIPDNSTARLGGGLIGERIIQIALGDSRDPVARDDTLRGVVDPAFTDEITAQITPLREKAEQVMAKADSVLAAVHSILDHESRKRITESIEKLHGTMGSLESASATADKTLSKESERLSDIMENILAVSANLEDNNTLLNHIMQNMADVSDTMASDKVQTTLDDIARSMEMLAGILENVDHGKGTAGLLFHDEVLYHNLVESSEQLELLLEDIRENPGRYFRISIFGR